MHEERINQALKSFLVQHREEIGYSQTEVAARSDLPGFGRILDQKSVSRLENSPLWADSLKLSAYLSATGIDAQKYFALVDKLTYEKDDTMTETNANQAGLETIERTLEKINSAKKVIENSSHSYIQSLNVLSPFENAESLLGHLKGKTTIGVFGQFDAGKSTVLNVILGTDLLPARYQPATSVVNLLMHTSDRPEFLTGQVAVFKKGFKPYMIESPEIVEQYLIEQGGKEILHRLGLHNYDTDEVNEAYIAVAFSDAEILKDVWLLDTPGDMNSADESDTEKALAGVELVHGVVYVSGVTGFLKDGDLGLAANILRQLPPVDPAEPLKHLLFLQSHCHSEVTEESIKQVREVSFKRLKRQFETLVFQPWKDDEAISSIPQPSDLSARTIPFWRENDDYRKQTISSVREMANNLLKKREEIIRRRADQILEDLHNSLQNNINTLESRKEAVEDRVKEVQEKEARFRSEADDAVKDLQELVENCKSYEEESIDDLKMFYDSKTSVEGLEELIRESFDDRKEAQKDIGDLVGQLLTAKVESNLKLRGRDISKRLDTLLERWQSIVPEESVSWESTSSASLAYAPKSFDSRAAFIGGLSGLTSFGAMALYASTIASNLGAYILVGKVAGVLVSMGLVGSVTTVTSFVAAIGGPITIGIAIAAAIGLLVYRLAGGSWQKSLAKKVSKAIDKEDVWSDILDVVQKYWTETQTAMQTGLDALIDDTEAHISALKKDAAKEFNHDDLELCLTTLGKADAEITKHD